MGDQLPDPAARLSPETVANRNARAGEAAAEFGGPVVLARDLDRIPVPPGAGLRAGPVA
jgi:hypothetical protein